jgi:hypothetical protein
MRRPKTSAAVFATDRSGVTPALPVSRRDFFTMSI